MFEDRALAALFPTAAEIPDAARVRPDEHPPVMLIGGELRAAASADVTAPIYSRVATRNAAGELEPVLVGYEPKVGPVEAVAAIDASNRAFAGGNGAWPTAKPAERIAAVERFATRLAANTDTIARLLMWEIGKGIASARAEVTRSIAYIEDTIADYRALGDGPLYSGVAGATTHHAKDVMRPLGQVLCVAPFNYPINEFLTTIIPALLVGNVVIAKTPRFGTLANQQLAAAFAECFPAGVVSLLPGDGRVVLPAVISHKTNDVFGNAKGTIDVLAFIGSEGAANAILGRHPTPSFVHKILGLGAKNAAIVLRGADPDVVAPKLVKGALGFNGQRCTAEKLVFAPAGPEGDALVARLADRVAKLPLGMPWDPAAAITPLPEPTKLATMWSMLDDAVARGATIVNERGGTGYFSIMRPAVVDHVQPGMRLHHEEQFGPIVPVARYHSLAEVIDWHIRSPYGQQAGIHGPESPERTELVHALASFVARINLDDVCQRGPDTFGFTAADKSGFGTLSIREALRSFSRSVIVQSPDRGAVERV